LKFLSWVVLSRANYVCRAVVLDVPKLTRVLVIEMNDGRRSK